MSSNVVKSFHTIKESSTPRVIDGNIVVGEIIEKLRSAENDAGARNFEWNDFGPGSEGGLEGSFEELVGDLDEKSLDLLVGDEGTGDATGENVSGGNVIKANILAEATSVRERMLAEVEAEKKRLLEEAAAEAEMIKNLAKEEIARDKSIATEMGRQEGYEAGMNQANMEFKQMQEQLELERRHLEQEYEDMMFDLEPQFVRHITNIYEKVFQMDLTDKKEIVLNVLQNAMQKIEGTKNYIIHVSKEDYAFVNERKNILADATLAVDVIVDIVEDITMRQGDCMIETANGIFDCGIDTQLNAIKNRLVLLSYNGRD